jgi:hypothetical protein
MLLRVLEERYRSGKWLAPYTPHELFVTAFGVDASPGQSLHDVLETGGGGLAALGR